MTTDRRAYVGPYNPVKRAAMDMQATRHMRLLLAAAVHRAQAEARRSRGEIEEYEREHGFRRGGPGEIHTRRGAGGFHG